MRQFTSNELRKAWKQFYIDRGHVDVGAVSLVSDGSTGVMFNVAGMQPLMPYLLGQKHPLGTRLCNVQGCVRTNDIDSVGDKSHVTFFEMLGSWSLGDYFKKERCQWSFELLTQVFGFDADHLAATVFAGDDNAPRDEEGAQYRIASGFKKENVYYLLPERVMRRAQAQHVPVWLVAGKASDAESLLNAGFSRVDSLTPDGMPLEEAIRPEVARKNIHRWVETVWNQLKK